MRSAMTEARGARQAFDQSVQDFMATAAAAMSPAGRSKLADWPPSQRSGKQHEQISQSGSGVIRRRVW